MEIIATNDTSLETSSRSFDNYYNGIDKSDIDAIFKDSDPFLEEFIEFKQAFYRHKEPGSILLVTLYIPVFLMAFFGNVMVLFVVLPNRHMRNVTNFFLVNLAVADLTGGRLLILDFENVTRSCLLVGTVIISQLCLVQI